MSSLPLRVVTVTFIFSRNEIDPVQYLKIKKDPFDEFKEREQDLSEQRN